MSDRRFRNPNEVLPLPIGVGVGSTFPIGNRAIYRTIFLGKTHANQQQGGKPYPNRTKSPIGHEEKPDGAQRLMVEEEKNRGHLVIDCSKISKFVGTSENFFRFSMVSVAAYFSKSRPVSQIPYSGTRHPNMSDKVTIYDIAKKLGITAATVSRALNNNPKISEATRKLVIQTAKEMDYKQNRLAKALKSGKSHNVAVIVPYINKNFFASVIGGIEEELNPLGYHVIICQSHDREKQEIEHVNALLNAQVDGILMSIAKTTRQYHHFERVLAEKVPLVFFDRGVALDGVGQVTVDDFKGGHLATAHLIAQGCRKVAHFSGDPSLDIYRNRAAGYKQALKEHGLKVHPHYYISDVSSIEAGIAAVDQWMALDDPPDALFSSSDHVALGAIQRLKTMGIRIPEDFCVVGFSNEPFTGFMELPISTVEQFPMQMGRLTAQTFIDQLKEGEQLQVGRNIVLSPELLIRKSSCRNEIGTPTV